MRLTKLAKIIAKSESIHWKRIIGLFNRIHNWSGKLIAWPIIAIIVSIFHYLFSGMHTLFEITLIIFRPRQFDLNMKALEDRYSERDDL